MKRIAAATFALLTLLVAYLARIAALDAAGPALTAPMGLISGLPVGISFIGPAWSEAQLLALGAAYERAAHARRAPAYPPSVETTPMMLDVLAPRANPVR